MHATGKVRSIPVPHASVKVSYHRRKASCMNLECVVAHLGQLGRIVPNGVGFEFIGFDWGFF